MASDPTPDATYQHPAASHDEAATNPGTELPAPVEDVVGMAGPSNASISSPHVDATASRESLGEVTSAHSSSIFSVGLSVDNSDADSFVDQIDRGSSTMSATSSVFAFVEENGRTYHSYKDGKYILPNDIPEQERLDLQHAITVRLLGGLTLAPVSGPPRVLDIGTGTGIWCVEFANEQPASDVLGIDLSPIQPEYVPPNCRFEVCDVEEEWIYSYKFDYVHSRFMVSAITDFRSIFNSCYENLNPDGWVEFQEFYVPFQCIDDSFTGTAMERWNKLLMEALDKLGRDGGAAAHFKRWMRQAGFVDVVERKFALPANPWAKGEDNKTLGVMQMTNFLDGVHGITIRLFTSVLGWSPEQVELFLVDVRKDLQNTNIHVYYVLYCVYGRKPRPGEGSVHP